MKQSTVAILVSCLTTGQAFVTTSTIKTQNIRSFDSALTMTVSDFSDNSSSSSADELPPLRKSKAPEMSEAIPFLARPKVLTKELAGDFGFDPLNFAKNREALWYYREIEIKHARLAMLAAAGWPTSELLDRPIADYFNLPSVLDDMDRAPSPLSLMLGDGSDVRPEFWGFCLGLTAAIDSYQTHRSRTQTDYTPGDLGWDPLQCAATEESKKQMQLAEMQNGRLAMLGVTGFAVQEFVIPQAVVEETPVFFQPITETAELLLKSILE